MARFSRMEVLNKMVEVGVVPVFYHDDLEVAKKVFTACSAGGMKVIEFTNRGDLAYQTFCELVRYFAKEDPSLILGVGSIVDAGTASLYISSGANFIVGPVTNPDVAKVCNRRKVPYSPGCGSASEVSAAEELGVEICKVFPGTEVGGPAFIKNILAPMPWSKIMVTGGVQATEESVSAWIKAGAAAVGMGSDLIKKEMIAAGDYESLKVRAAKVVGYVRKARGLPMFGAIEHVGVYPLEEGGTSAQTAEWYNRAFGWPTSKAGSSGFFSNKGNLGFIEAMAKPAAERCHIAVKVWDFDAACEDLKARGYELGEVRDLGDSKLVYLKQRDPGGNTVHLVWRP